MTLRTSDMHWVRNKYIGVAPTRRYGHSATAIGPHLIIFGGFDGGKPLNDVVVLRDRAVGAKAETPTEGEAYEGDAGEDDEEEYDDDEGGDDFELDTGEN
mmetsp:Transcript_92797/g.258067  ORF Transcript_92797/g.258067 Transcript_92797/m.258067 type:complete len:100 (+) Transcript_92797:2-301(+)